MRHGFFPNVTAVMNGVTLVNELGKRCKQVIGARVWSEVPLNIKSLPFPMFVKKVKEYLAYKYKE